MYVLRLLIIVCATGSVGVVALHRKEPACNYQACHPVRPGMLNVHLIPHSHDDVGWLKTVDQYFYGSKTSIQNAGVEYIINSVLNELRNNPDRRFVQVETAYLWMWWEEQPQSQRHLLHQLVQRGQLEIIGGGWCMNDEATTHYQSVIDQFTWGFRRLQDMLGACVRPRIAWQIDTFGHSRVMASLFAQFGFDALFFARMDFREKLHKLHNKTAEFIWQGSPHNLGNKSDIFTSVLYRHYSSPPGFCFDVLCNDEPIIDNPQSPDYNVERKVSAFIKLCHQQAKHFVTNNILVPMGDDFHYMNANTNYKNMDKLIRHVNAQQMEGSNVHVLYSTPECYLQAVHSVLTADHQLSNRLFDHQDLLPYASGQHSEWTGFYTSKPNLKYMERTANNYLQVCKQMAALADLGEMGLNDLRQAVATMQHHDAITGTARKVVVEDYVSLLHRGMVYCEEVIEAAFNKLTMIEDDRDLPIKVNSCFLHNISQCTVSEKSSQFVTTVYNPLSHPVTYAVRLPVQNWSYSVRDQKGVEQPVQLVPIPDTLLSLPERQSDSTNELVFMAVKVPALGFRSYYVTKLEGQASTEQEHAENSFREHDQAEKQDVIIGNERLQVVLNRNTGIMQQVITDGTTVNLCQDFHYYRGFPGHNFAERYRASGAYVFRPLENISFPVRNENGVEPEFTVHKGPVVEEVHQKFSNWVSQVVRVYKDENHVELQWMVGPIPVFNFHGKEVISRFTTDLLTNGSFYTDANGRELMHRRRNHRGNRKVDMPEPVAGNYYPVTTRIVLRDVVRPIEVAVINDRAQGGSSLQDGQLELMVHRRLLYDDGFGVGEPLNEHDYGHGKVVRGHHYLVVGPTDRVVVQQRMLAQSKHLSPWVFLTPADDMKFHQWTQNRNMEFSGLHHPLHPSIRLLTLEPWRSGSLLLRLEHVMEKGEDPLLSVPVTVDIQKMFAVFSPTSIHETMLGADRPKEHTHQYIWKKKHNNHHHDHLQQQNIPHDEGTMITLQPMEIRTFIIEVK